MKEMPKYKIIENYIIDRIQSGDLKPGDQIETEKQLSEKFDIGRLTVNKALINLAQEGYIERTAGKGSFVLPRMVIKSISQGGSFTDDMASVGMKAGSQLIEYKVYKASDVPEVAEYLELADDELIHYFVRLRTGDGEPIALSYTYISAKIVPAINVKALEGSLTEYLHSVGVYRGGALHKMSAHLPSESQKKLLGVGNVALLLNEHITYDEQRHPYEYIKTYYISSQYAYTFRTGFLAER